MTAHLLTALLPIFENEQSTRLDTSVHSSSGPGDRGQNKYTDGPGGAPAFRKGILRAIVILLVAVAGIGIYYMVRERGITRQKEDINAIHKREVQKAIRELNAEKLAKKSAEERREQLNLRKAELQSLKAQLQQVDENKADALSELDEIRQPHLFRSRAKKEAQLSGQLQIIDRLDAMATSLRNRISSCQAAADTLSAGLRP